MQDHINVIKNQLAIDSAGTHAFTECGEDSRLNKAGRWVKIDKATRLALADKGVALYVNRVVETAREYGVMPGFKAPPISETKDIKSYASKLCKKLWDGLTNKGKRPIESEVRAKDALRISQKLLKDWPVLKANLEAGMKGDRKPDVVVEDDGQDRSPQTNLDFTPGCPSFVEKATVNRKGQTGKVELRHKTLQKELYKHLCKEAGADNVQVERPLSIGGKVDTSVRHNGRESFYEVKVDSDIRSCIREALGQLIEYAYYPSEDRAGELIIVSEAELDSDSLAYLQFLRQRFGLSLWYRRIDMNRHILKSKS